MMIITGLSFSLSIVSMMTISTISITMSIAMMIISWLSSSGGFSLSLSIVAMMTISTISMSIAMMVVARLSFSLSIVSMVSISTISMTISMVISWFSSSCAKDGKGNSNQKIHVVFVVFGSLEDTFPVRDPRSPL